MQAYFNPEISKLREVPRAEAERLLAPAPEAADRQAPDTQLVTHLLHMIHIARQQSDAPCPASP